MILECSTEFVIFVVFYATLIILLPLVLVCKVFKKFLQIYLSIKHGEDIKFLTGNDTMFVMGGSSPQPIMDVTVLVKGNLDIKYIKGLVETNWTNAKRHGEQSYKHPRARSRVANSLGYFYWLKDQNFHIDNHVQLHNCTPPKDKSELLKVISEICSKELPEDKSFWKVLLIPMDESYYNEPSYVILLRMHHVLMDGYNLLRLFLDCFFDPKTVKLLSGRKRHPISGLSIINYIISLYKFPKYMMSLPFLPSNNVLHKDEQTGERVVGLARPVSIERVKRIGKSTGTTINDILVSCVSAAMIRFFQEQEMPPEGCNFYIPIALNYDDEEASFSNRASAISLVLQRSSEGPVQLLEATREELMTKFWKFQYGAVYDGLTRLLFNQLPSALMVIMNRIYTFTYFVTNVPGPLDECLMKNGDKVTKLLPIPILLLKTGIGFGVTSYNGEVQIAVKTDLGAVKDPEFANRIMDYFNAEFEKLEAATKNA